MFKVKIQETFLTIINYVRALLSPSSARWGNFLVRQQFGMKTLDGIKIYYLKFALSLGDKCVCGRCHLIVANFHLTKNLSRRIKFKEADDGNLKLCTAALVGTFEVHFVAAKKKNYTRILSNIVTKRMTIWRPSDYIATKFSYFKLSWWSENEFAIASGDSPFDAERLSMSAESTLAQLLAAFFVARNSIIFSSCAVRYRVFVVVKKRWEKK